jgi:hypothetical protein
LAAAAIVAFGLATPAMAATEASDSPSVHVLDSDASEITFNSAFCEVGTPTDPVTVELTDPSGGDAAGLTITGLALRNSKGTPSKSNGGGKRNPTWTASAFGLTSIVITMTDFDGGKTAHFGLVLSNGDILGVNLHTNPCDV